MLHGGIGRLPLPQGRGVGLVRVRPQVVHQGGLARGARKPQGLHHALFAGGVVEAQALGHDGLVGQALVAGVHRVGVDRWESGRALRDQAQFQVASLPIQSPCIRVRQVLFLNE